MSGWWLASYVVLWLLVVTLAVLLVALARRVGAVHPLPGRDRALEIDTEGPELWSEAPAIAGVSLRGGPATIGGEGLLRLLLFASPGSSLCDELLPAIGSLGRDAQATIVMDARPEELRRRRFEAPVVSAPDAFVAYSVPGTPYAVVLDGDGAVAAKGTLSDPLQLEGLLLTARRRAAERHERMAFA